MCVYTHIHAYCCCCSVTKSCSTLQLYRLSLLSFTISWSLLKFMSIVSVMLSSHLILCQPLLLLPTVFPRIRVLANMSALCIRWPKYWSFSFNISPSNEYSRLISFSIHWLISFLSREFSRVFSSTTIQMISSSVLSLIYGTTLTSVHGYWKNHTFDYMDLCQQCDISAFQYSVSVCHSFPSKEQVSFNFMATVICADFGAHVKEICQCFHFSPSICHEMMGSDAMILIF